MSGRYRTIVADPPWDYPEGFAGGHSRTPGRWAGPVVTAPSVRIACRLRQDAYRSAFGDEFTIRSSRPSGVRTELRKVIAGWGRYFFYGFASDTLGLTEWTLGDLNVFREWWATELWRHGTPPGTRRSNHDGSSEFYAYRLADLPPGFVVAYHREAVAA